MEKGILETVGAEIISIISPVSICMLLVVLLVRSLTPHGSAAPVASIAMLVYDEQPTDSFSEKLGGAFLNALVFVAIVTVVTFLLVLLFYFRCTKCLKGYMGFSAFTILAYMGGGVVVLLIQRWSIPIDVITFSICLFNFSIVGVLAVFFSRMPIVLTQGYLVFIGMLVAFWFTMLPEWTTWVLLMAMAIYDIVAVLVPGGPLNMLVELAISRDEELPALIYEARPIMTNEMPAPPRLSSTSTAPPLVRTQPRRWNRRRASRSVATQNRPGLSSQVIATELGRAEQGTQNGSPDRVLSSGEGETILLSVPPAPHAGTLGSRLDSVSGDVGSPNTNVNDLQNPENSLSGTASSPLEFDADDDTAPLVRGLIPTLFPMEAAMERMEAGGPVTTLDEPDDDDDGLGISGAIKLGLGDFIFYSVLVGRAAMFDLMTVYACYLAIIAGLGATLILLAFWRRALPALPISISLGVVFYLLTRLILDPFVVDLATHLVFF